MSRKSTIPQLLLSFLMITISGCNVPANGAASLPTSPTAVILPVSTETAVATATVEVPPTATSNCLADRGACSQAGPPHIYKERLLPQRSGCAIFRHRQFQTG